MEIPAESSTNELLERLGSDLTTLSQRGLSFRSPNELIAVLDTGPKLRAQIDSLFCSAAAEVDRWGLAKDAGYRTVDQMVGDRTGSDPKQTRADVRLGRWIDDFDEFTTAWAAGLMSTAHLDLIRRSVDNSRTRIALVRDQAMFVEWVADYDFTDFEHCCTYWLTANDPDGAEPKDQVASNKLKIRKQADGTVKGSFHLDPLLGDAIKTAVEHEEQKLFRAAQSNDDTLGEFEDWDPQGASGTSQRSAQALGRLIARGFARQDGSYPIPLVNVVASEAVIEDTLARLNESSDEALPLSFSDIDKRCELIDGTPLHPSLLLATLGLATFRRQIMTAAGESVEVSVNARCFTPRQKQALLVEARGRCSTRGCDTPFAWLEGDHTMPHSNGGPTSLANATMKCGSDNKAKRDGPDFKSKDPDRKRYKPAA